MSKPSISIIGAGPTGLALALALHRHTSYRITVFESRPTPLDLNGAVTLTPNALRVLEHLSAYQSIKLKSFEYNDLVFRNCEDEVVDACPFGSRSIYGYPALRVYREVLIRALLDAVNVLDIPVVCNKTFAQVTNETPENVSWSFSDGTSCSGTFLIGADGIHSRVRKFLHPNIVPVFTGAAAITATVSQRQLQVSEHYALPTTILHQTHSAYILAPQMPDGSEILIGKQLRLEERDRLGWHEYRQDKSAMLAFLQQDAHEFPAAVQNAISHVQPDSINIWPFYQVPRLERWTSTLGRVVIMGDAAHAILPTAGQGVNQALEDVLTFARMIERDDSVDEWHKGRQRRIDRVSRLSEELSRRRLPGWEGKAGEGYNLEWLYGVSLEGMLDIS